MSKMWILLVLAIILLAGLFACVPTSEPSPMPVPEPTPTPSPTPTPIPTPTPASIPTRPGTELPPSSYLPEIPRISAEEVKAKSDAGINLVIIDSRSDTSYSQSHIAGAISIPLSIMAEPYSALDSYDEIITYCT